MVTEPRSSQARAMRFLEALYDHSKTTSDPALVEHLASGAGLTEQEGHYAWSYLKDKGLIQTFGVPHTARINAHGIDAIEEAEQHPDQPARSFPAVTYNIVNNTTNIGTAFNSPVQQTAGSSQPDQSKSASTKKAFIERLTSRTTALTALLVAVTALLAAIPQKRRLMSIAASFLVRRLRRGRRCLCRPQLLRPQPAMHQQQSSFFSTRSTRLMVAARSPAPLAK